MPLQLLCSPCENTDISTFYAVLIETSITQICSIANIKEQDKIQDTARRYFQPFIKPHDHSYTNNRPKLFCQTFNQQFMYKEVLSYIRWQLFFHPSIDTPFKTILPCQFPSPFIIHISRLQIIMLLLLQGVFKMGVYVGYLVKKFDKRLSDKYPGQCPLEHTPRRTNAPC